MPESVYKVSRVGRHQHRVLGEGSCSRRNAGGGGACAIYGWQRSHNSTCN